MRIKLLISSSVVPQSEDYTQPLCLPCRLWDSFIPRQVHRGDGVQGHRLLSSGLKRWLQSIPEDQRSSAVWRACAAPQHMAAHPLFHYSTIPQEREMGRKGNAGSFPSMGATQGSNSPWMTSPRAPALLQSNDNTLNPRKETGPSPFSFS